MDYEEIAIAIPSNQGKVNEAGIIQANMIPHQEE